MPEDRREDGLVGSFSVAENLVLDIYDRPPFASGINLNLPAIRANATARIEEFDVRTGSRRHPGGHPVRRQPAEGHPGPGGRARAKVLIASQPTRGLDVGSIEFVHRRIVEQRDHGVAVLIVSSELDEIYALADRIAVMYEGKITGFRDPDVPAAELGRLMAGGADGGGVIEFARCRRWTGATAAEEAAHAPAPEASEAPNSRAPKAPEPPEASEAPEAPEADTTSQEDS